MCHTILASDLDTARLIMGLELYVGRKTDPDNSLLIFDEVQEVPRALTSLKYFYENAPQYHIVCAGSLFGIALHQGTSFPVGKVDFLKLYPLSFKEFLMATDRERFVELLDKQDFVCCGTAFLLSWRRRIKSSSTVLFVRVLVRKTMKPQFYYYTNDRGSCEVDFVVDTGEQIVPVEVKAEVNLRAKSLKTYQEKFSPDISIRTSMSDYKKEEWFVNLPLYAIDQIAEVAAGGINSVLLR